ncbi:MAG: ATP-binding cassette domain-containing protein [Pigmentiphaga sp.]
MTRPAASEIAQFLSRTIILRALAAMAVGVLLFAVELGMATSIQAFFGALNLVEAPAGGEGWFPFVTLKEVMAALIAVGTARGLLVWVQSYLSGLATTEFETLNRRRITAWALSSRSARLAEATQLFTDKTVGAGAFVASLTGSLNRVIVAVLLASSLLFLAPLVTLSAFALLLLLAVPFRMIACRLKRSAVTAHREFDNSVDRLLRGVKNSLFLHIYGLADAEENRVQGHLSRYLAGYRAYYFLNGLKTMLPQVIGIWLVCAITVVAVETGSLGDGDIVKFFYLFIRFVQGIAEIASLASYLTLNFPRTQALWTWWRQQRPQTAAYSSKDVPSAEGFGSPVGWRIRSLSYTYAGDCRPILSDLSCDIRPGSTFVVTGESGAGKSTLVNILVGLEEPTGGSVEVCLGDGSAYPLDAARPRLLGSLGYVGPESFIIPGTIRENLHFGANAEYRDDELVAALQQAECLFVFDLPAGLDHWLTEQGEGLSAGQKQRLALARALLRRPDALILDEATANLDGATEAALVETLRGLKEKTTIIAITHREALLAIADVRLALFPGKAAEICDVSMPLRAS